MSSKESIIKKEPKKEEVKEDLKQAVIQQDDLKKEAPKKAAPKKEAADKDKLIAELKAKLAEEKDKNKTLINTSNMGVEIHNDKFSKKIFIPKTNVTKGKVVHRDVPVVVASSKKKARKK